MGSHFGTRVLLISGSLSSSFHVDRWFEPRFIIERQLPTNLLNQDAEFRHVRNMYLRRHSRERVTKAAGAYSRVIDRQLRSNAPVSPGLRWVDAVSASPVPGNNKMIDGSCPACCAPLNSIRRWSRFKCFLGRNLPLRGEFWVTIFEAFDDVARGNSLMHSLGRF